MKIKILHFVPGFDHGGIESRLIDWYQEIDRNTFQFELIVSKDIENNLLIRKFEDLGGKVYRIPSFSLKNLKKFNSSIKKILLMNKYDVVHCHNPTSGAFFLKVAKSVGIKKRIMHSRTNKFPDSIRYPKIRDFLKSRAVKYSNIHLACSNSAGEWLYKSKEFGIIRNGIDTSIFKFDNSIRQQLRSNLNISEDEIILGIVARLTPSKNHKFIIDILEYLEKEKPEKYKFLIVGDGPLRFEIAEYAKRLNIENNVIFVGKKENVYDYYQVMDIFVFPSEYEGFGTVSVESQSTGLKTLISTGVPKDVMITDLVYQLPLSLGAKKWGQAILQYDIDCREDRSKEVSTKGFDISSSVEKLKLYYQ